MNLNNIIKVDKDTDINNYQSEYPNRFICTDCGDLVLYKNNIPTPSHFKDGICLECGEKRLKDYMHKFSKETLNISI